MRRSKRNKKTTDRYRKEGVAICCGLFIMAMVKITSEMTKKKEEGKILDVLWHDRFGNRL